MKTFKAGTNNANKTLISYRHWPRNYITNTPVGVSYTNDEFQPDDEVFIPQFGFNSMAWATLSNLYVLEQPKRYENNLTAIDVFFKLCFCLPRNRTYNRQYL